MPRGKHLSLEEAREQKQLDRFAKEHETEGNEDKFRRLLGLMAKPKSSEAGDQTSEQD